MILEPEPIDPAPVICNPATLPVSELAKLLSLIVLILSPSTVVTAYPSDFFSLEIPKDVITTSFKNESSAFMEIFTLSDDPTISLVVSKPINEASNTASSFSICIVNFPSKSEVVPFSVPTSKIDAPGRGLPSESEIVPLIVLFCSSWFTSIELGERFLEFFLIMTSLSRISKMKLFGKIFLKILSRNTFSKLIVTFGKPANNSEL